MMKSKELKLWQKFALGVSTGLGIASGLQGTANNALRLLADLDESKKINVKVSFEDWKEETLDAVNKSDNAVANGYVMNDSDSDAKNAIEELKLEYKASDQDWTYGYDGEGRRLSFEEFIYKKYGLKTKGENNGKKST